MQLPPDPSGRIVGYSSPEDKCPQCKTDRYLNPKLKLLVSPCYHKMCESCVDRIFSLGPAPCPECGHKCRKYEFGVQTFQDLQVEREVDVRVRVGKLFNKTEEDFDTLKEYNDYLEEVENILFNLINNIDVARTEARIETYKASNKSSIQNNVRNQAAEAEAQRAKEGAEKKLRAERAARRRQREERDKKEREQDEHNVVEALAGRGGSNVESVIRQQQENELRRQERMAEEEQREEQEAHRILVLLNSSVSSKKARENPPDNPSRGWSGFSVEFLLDFDGPFGSLDDSSSLFESTATPLHLGGQVNSTGYEDPWITKLPDKDEILRLRAGGFDWRHTWERDIRCAIMGIGAQPP